MENASALVAVASTLAGASTLGITNELPQSPEDSVDDSSQKEKMITRIRQRLWTGY
jgi:hypothetical protein